MKAVICPVCNGNGQVSSGFYSHPGDYPFWMTGDTAFETCMSCEGRGWVEVREDYLCPTHESHSTTDYEADYEIVEHEIIPETE